MRLASMRFVALPPVIVLSLAQSSCAQTPSPTPEQNPYTLSGEEDAASSLPNEFREAAKHTSFPAFLVEAGVRYDRLTGAVLVKALTKEALCPSPACSGIDGIVSVFRSDGRYLAYGDRWEGEGRYAIVNGVVTVSIDGTIRDYAFYRSRGGALRQAWVSDSGSIESSRIFTR